MFFLWAYGIINVAAFVESAGANPSFRPRFKLFHWSIALLGAVGCIGVAFLINPLFALIALFLIVILFSYVRQTVLATSFGDARRGYFYSRVRRNLQMLESMPKHAKNWRPTPLIYTDTIEDLYKNLNSSEKGISSKDREEKQKKFGKNTLPVAKKKWLKMLLSEFTSPLVFILIAAVFLMLLVPILESGHISSHDLIEPIAIIFILLFNGLLGFFQEWKAENTLEALKTLQPEFASVVRDEKNIKIKTEDLLPGDIILLSEGEKIPADIRLTEAHDAKVNESLLTGESEAVYKTTKSSTEENPENIVFSGSELISGRAKGIVVFTGIHTKIGQIAHMLTEIERPVSPMEKKLESLSKKIGIGMVLLCVVVFVLATMQDIPWIDALFTAIALAVAAVPEGLPAVMTISLAIGVAVMARKKTLVNRQIKKLNL